MKLTMKMPTEPDHDHLATLINYAVAAQLRDSLNYSGIAESDVWEVTSSAVFAIARMFDKGVFEVNGKTYRPRVAFVDHSGNLLPGAEKFDYLHDYAAVEEDELEPSENFSITVS